MLMTHTHTPILTSANYWLSNVLPQPLNSSAHPSAKPRSSGHSNSQRMVEVVPSPKMVTNLQLVTIPMIGCFLKVGGHPIPQVGKFANRGKWHDRKSIELWREALSKVLHFQSVFQKWKSPLESSSPIGVGIGESLLGSCAPQALSYFLPSLFLAHWHFCQ